MRCITGTRYAVGIAALVVIIVLGTAPAFGQSATLTLLTVNDVYEITPVQGQWGLAELTLQRHFFSPPSLGAYDVRDTLGDCAVAPRPRRRGAPQSYTHAGVTRLQITGGAATPSALALFFPKRPFKCHRKKCARSEERR